MSLRQAGKAEAAALKVLPRENPLKAQAMVHPISKMMSCLVLL